METGITDIGTAREWAKLPAEARRVLLASAWCPDCGATSFRQGYSLRKDDFGVVITGCCSACGAPIARCCY